MSEQDRTEQTSLASRVRAGVALLDYTRPNWWTRIDPDRLCIWSPCNCVLGQLDGDYERGADAMFGEDEQYGNPRAYGLEGYSDNPDGYRVETQRLTRLWSFVIRQRQAVSQ